MERFNRAERRAQIDRLKAKRKNYWGYPYQNWGERPVPMDPKQLGRVVQHPQACSCMGCGNQRKYVGPTLRERIQQCDFDEYGKDTAMD